MEWRILFWWFIGVITLFNGHPQWNDNITSPLCAVSFRFQDHFIILMAKVQTGWQKTVPDPNWRFRVFHCSIPAITKDLLGSFMFRNLSHLMKTTRNFCVIRRKLYVVRIGCMITIVTVHTCRQKSDKNTSMSSNVTGPSEFEKFFCDDTTSLKTNHRFQQWFYITM